MAINWSAVQMANQSGNIYCSASDWVFYYGIYDVCLYRIFAILNFESQAHFVNIANLQKCQIINQMSDCNYPNCTFEISNPNVNRSSNVLAPNNSLGHSDKSAFPQSVRK